MSQTNYSIDLKAAKGTKLFKKFLQSKNKSAIQSNNHPQTKHLNEQIMSRNLNLQENSIPPTFQQVSSPHQEPQKYERFGKQVQEYKNEQVRGETKIPTFTFSHNQMRPIEERKTERIGDRNYDNNKNRDFQKQRFTNYRYHEKQSQEQPVTNTSHNYNSPPKATLHIYGQDPMNSKKYNKLADQHEQLSHQLAIQRKNHKIQILKFQEQIEFLNKKVYELGSREDDLILENRKLKQRNQAENKNRIQLEESNRQFGYQIQQLKDMMDGNQQSINKKQEQILYLRKINEEMKQQLKYLAAENQKLRDSLSVFERERNTVDREKSTKQIHISELREKINSVINQNSILKDQIFHLTTKLYQIQQENKTLKADLRRQSDQFPMDYLYQQMQHSSYQQRGKPHQNINYSNQPKFSQEQVHEINTQDRQERRGEFARQRNQRRNRRQFAKEHTAMIQGEKTTEKPQQMPNNQKRQFQQKLRRLQNLHEQVQKLKDCKAMNGAMRRQKITLQRQIQEIEQYLKANDH